MNKITLIPVAFRLPWSRFIPSTILSRAEIVATKFNDNEVPIKWAIREGGCVLSKLGCWEIELNSSSRDDEFFRLCRYDSVDEAFQIALKWFFDHL